ncbi:MAG TPA: class I SAM-dependent methyltransferase [Roseiflexaceae bacterium]|nr:class I SAM-dependent methyltransferase [Roseiflexaceae bacterium]
MIKNPEPRTKNQEPRTDEAVLGSGFSVGYPLGGSPFDEMAADYDRSFTTSTIGSLMRQAVWWRLDACFRPGDRVLELNCGTGADAIHLARRGVRVLATDIAPAMLELTRAKVAQAGLESMVEVRQLALEDLRLTIDDLRLRSAPDQIVNRKSEIVNQFDGALSNFGGLNCVADLSGVAAGLAACLRPGAPALLCVMGPLVPWEWAWYLGRRQPAKAFRRLRRGGVAWRGLTIRYPSIGSLRRAFGPWFRLRRASAVGALLPPSYVEGWAVRRPRLLARLNRWERRIETLPPLPWLADHYLLELQRL